MPWICFWPTSRKAPSSASLPRSLLGAMSTAELCSWGCRRSRTSSSICLARQTSKVTFAASSQPLLQVHTREAFLCFKEACAGIGGLSLGAQHAGMRPLAHLDHSQLAVDTLRLQGHSNVILGDAPTPAWFTSSTAVPEGHPVS